jgi:hypothetical protein
MTTATKSSITLPPDELRLVLRLRRDLKAPSNVDVVRRALALLAADHERQVQVRDLKLASLAVRKVLAAEVRDLDALASNGLDP